MVDLVATVLLFMVSFLGVLLIPILLYTTIFFTDQGVPGIALYGVVFAWVGIPTAIVAVPIACVVWALRADGVTFYIPLVAMVGQVAAVAAILELTMALVTKGLRDHEKAKAARGDLAES
ncbi:hypothetical protein [Williamsia sp. CHRR-6]|uniref:hypothetical protein n=1 Tax=Williamsia sp. CHRR-6 TaxID=2835871 RepID=UPI001BDAA994|nr:hypothetical protein [Williamsia sp. CHRR-6]MBT0567397.1 hypothetical protein [Williamsia sp. CHRR-6]